MSTELAFALVLIATQRAPAAQRPAETRSAHDFNTVRGTSRSDQRVPACGNVGFRHPSFATPFHHRSFLAESVVNGDFFGAPWGIPPYGGPFFPVGFGGLTPFVVWNEPVFVPPAPAAGVPPGLAQPVEPHGVTQIVPTLPPYGATTDIPDRLVEDLLGRRRPSLAQRAQAARLEAAGDTMFRAGYFARAAMRYQQTLAQTPDDDEAKFKRGAALAAAGQYVEASRALREALRDRPDWPFVQHDLVALFPDEAAIDKLLENLDREGRHADSELDLLFVRAYILYFSGRRDAAELILRNPPGRAAPAHFELFLNAIERARQGR